MSSTLVPFYPPLGPQPPNVAFYSPSEITLTMKEKVFSLSGDDFTIATSTGQHICKCEGRMLSSKKVFTDMQGTGIFTIKKKYFALHKSFVCESPRGYNFEVNGHFSLGSSKSSVHFRNASDGQEIELDFKGDWFNRSAMITLAGRPVAELEKKSKFMNAGEFFGDQQTYFVTVAPNVDLTLIAAICVCFDEREHDE